VRAGLWLADQAERWFPDAFVFAVLAVLLSFLLACTLGGESPLQAVEIFGSSFWDLDKFTVQMAMVIIGGYVVASSPPVYRLLRLLAGLPRSPRAAVAFVAFFSMTTSLLSWGLSLVVTGLLVREICNRVQRVDYRAIGAAAYLGLGSVWALGLSSSAALLQASPTSLPPRVMEVTGILPLGQTIFLWPSLVMAAVLVAASTAIAYFSCPSAAEARTQEDFGIAYRPLTVELEPRSRPGEWLEYSPWLVIPVLILALAYVVRAFGKGILSVLDLNLFNFIFVFLGLALHGNTRSFLKAVAASVPAVAGVLIQFPFYAGAAGLISKTALAHRLAELFHAISSPETFPLVLAAYSAVLGLFVPSGGGKWVLEAPYVMQVARDYGIHLGWTVQIYNASEALPNLLNPFWMLPLMGILSVRARELAGYSILQLLFHVPLVFFMCWAFTGALPYVPPQMPSPP
jgi:short-chain fatty acids transporter